MLPRLAREPLVHFLALGALIFAAWYWFNPPQPPMEEIVVDQRQLDHLIALWKAEWKHDPSPRDVQAIIDRHVRKEVFYREGLRLNLDRNEEIIKRRLAQKMEAVAGDVGSLMKPVTDDDLRQFMRAHPEIFSLPQSYAFRQVLFLPSEREAALSTLGALRNGSAIPESEKDRMGVPNVWNETTAPDLANAFGDEFPAHLAELPLGRWAGPVESGYGLHLVHLDRRDAARLPTFESVRSYVRREYDYRAQLNAEQATFDTLRQRYRVRITAKGVPGETQTALASE
jgi:PPIC-type PPIASE domain